MKNPAAVALGRKAKGVPKTYTAEQLAVRTTRLAAARAKRWAGHTKKAQATMNRENP